jgi:NAD+-dependent secondary alcohol dehydrogenase Adh1
MKAVRLHEGEEQPRVDEVPEPEISGPFDVIVRVGCSGLCRTDVHLLEGLAAATGAPMPFTLGHENAGWVEAVGSEVGHLATGDAVILHPLMTCGWCRGCRDGVDTRCSDSRFPGMNADGGMAEYVKTDARSVLPLPDGLEPADVAAHADAGLTAYHAVAKASRLNLLGPGTSTVVLGAGGLGHIGIQILKAMSPTEVIAVDRRPDALEVARDCGADQVVEADGSHVDAMRELTGGADVVFDFVAEGGASADGARMLGHAGHYFVVGYGDELRLHTGLLVAAEQSYMGCLVGTYNELADLITLAAQGKVTVRTRTYPLDAALDALADFEAGRLQGRGVLVP